MCICLFPVQWASAIPVDMAIASNAIAKVLGIFLPPCAYGDFTRAAKAAPVQDWEVNKAPTLLDLDQKPAPASDVRVPLHYAPRFRATTSAAGRPDNAAAIRSPTWSLNVRTRSAARFT